MTNNISHVEESAQVDQGAIVGEGTRIWHFSHICRGARIGKNVSLGQNTFVGSKAIVGDNCKIQNNVSIYDDVLLEEGVFCGPSVVFTNVFNPRAFVNRKQEYRTTIVKTGASIGANATVVCGVTVGKYALIGAGAVVTKNVPDFALVTGVPARQTGWVSVFGEKLQFGIEGTAYCPHDNLVYHLKNGQVTCSPAK